MAGDLVIPQKLATSVTLWEGESGQAWLSRLPEIVAEVAASWDLEVMSPFEPGGNISWVAPVRRRTDGVDAVLKVQHPHPESAPEAAGLLAWNGAGAALLYEHDRDRCALLIERCRPGDELITCGGTDEAVVAGAAIGAELHAVTPPPNIPTLASVLDSWADELDARLEAHPAHDPGLARLAVATMRTRPRSCSDVCFLHGDLNPTNVLAAERRAWIAIDPKPMIGDPAYDAPRLITQPDPCQTPAPATTLRRRVDLVVETMGVDRDAVLAWCLVGAEELGASARASSQVDLAACCARHVDLLTPMLP